MNRNQAFRAALSMDQKKPRKKSKSSEPIILSPRGGGRDESYHSKNHIDDIMARAIDQRTILTRHADLLNRLAETKDVQGFIQDASPEIAHKLFLMAIEDDTPAKVKLEALRDLLDRAGYGKVTKHAVARFDASTSKDAIISQILGAQKDLKNAGIEIVDEDIEEGSGESSEG